MRDFGICARTREASALQAQPTRDLDPFSELSQYERALNVRIDKREDTLEWKATQAVCLQYICAMQVILLNLRGQSH